MIEYPMNLYYKAVVTIYATEDQPEQNPFGYVLDLIHRHIIEMTTLTPLRFHLNAYYAATSEDRLYKCIVASQRQPAPNPYPFHWALKLIRRDTDNPKRTWTTNIGIVQESPECLKLSFALSYSDVLGGCLTWYDSPMKRTPAFIDQLLDCSRLECASGLYTIPKHPLKLDANGIPTLLDIIYDPSRTLPVIVLCCPLVLKPFGLYQRLKCNAFLFYTDDPGVVMDLNDQLPPYMQVELDAFRVYVPISDQRVPHHPSLSVHDIMLNPRRAVDLLCAAYSENPRSSERRDFLTVDDIQRDRMSAILCTNKESLAAQAKRIEQLEAYTTKLENEKEALAGRISSCNETRIAEYEELLTACMRENDMQKEALIALIGKLYDGEGIGPFLCESSPVYHLAQAIQIYVMTQSKTLMKRKPQRDPAENHLLQA